MEHGAARRRGLVNIAKTISVLLACAAVYLFWGAALRETAGIIFGAGVLAFLVSPITKLLEKRLRPSLAAVLAVLGAALALLLLFALLLPTFIRQFAALGDILPDALLRLKRLADRIAGTLQRRLSGLELPALNFGALTASTGALLQGAAGAMGSAANGFYRLFLMLSLCCFFTADRKRILLRLELLVPISWRRLAVRAGSILVRELRLYLRGQATIALSVGTLAGLGLFLLGLKSAPLLGAIVGIFNVIPYFGPFLGGIPAVIMALSISWQKALFTLGLLFLVQQIDGMVISPRIMGNITGFSPAVVLIALFMGAQTGGIGGMLLALPTLMAIRTLYRVFVQRHENN